MNESTNQTVTLHVNINNVEEVEAKAQKLVDTLKEARTLAGELASLLDTLEVKI